MKNLMPLLALCLTILMSCSKDDISPATTNSSIKKDYLPLAVGNSWTYEHYTVDSLGNETLRPGGHTAFISSDTIISGKKYYVVDGDPFALSAMGAEYIRSEGGHVFFYGSINEDTLLCLNNLNLPYNYDTLRANNQDYLYSYTKSVSVSTIQTTSAGKFDCRQTTNFYTPVDPNYMWGERETHRFYSTNIGVVVSQFFLLQLSKHRRDAVKTVHYKLIHQIPDKQIKKQPKHIVYGCDKRPCCQGRVYFIFIQHQWNECSEYSSKHNN